VEALPLIIVEHHGAWLLGVTVLKNSQLEQAYRYRGRDGVHFLKMGEILKRAFLKATAVLPDIVEFLDQPTKLVDLYDSLGLLVCRNRFTCEQQPVER
jgi:hypothetical protein